MSNLFPVDYIPDPDRGRPLFNAKIYIGQPNTDPTVSGNQLDLTGDIGFPVGGVIDLTQPVRTNNGGVTVYNNTPVIINHPGQAYSIQIFDRFDNLIYNFPNVTEQLQLVPGGVPIGDGVWQVGKTYTTYNQYTLYNGMAWRVKPSTELPYTIQSPSPIGGLDEPFVQPFAQDELHTIALINGVNDSNVAYLEDGDLVGVTHLYNRSLQKVYFSESPLTGFMDNIGPDVDGVVSVDVDSVATSVYDTDLSGQEVSPSLQYLRDNPKAFIADEVYVKSHTAGENIGGGLFYWDAASTDTDNDGTVVQITGVTTGRWKRRIESNNEFDVTWFGAKGDNGTTDNLAKIVATEAALPSTGGTVIIRPVGLLSQYSVSDSVNFERSNTTLVIEKGAELFCENDTTDGHTFAFIERTTAQQIENVHVRGGGSVWNTAPGSNENTIGFARCRNYSCVGMKVPQSNRKGITAQVDCDNGYIAFNEIGATGDAGIAIEGDSQGGTQENDTCFIDSNTIDNAGAQGINVSFVAGPTTKRVRTRNNIVKLSAEQGMAFSGVDDLIHEGGDTVLSSLGRGFSYLQCVDISGEIRTENAELQGVSLDTCSGEIDLDIYVDFASRNNVGVYDAILVNSPGSTHKITPYVKGTAHKATLNSTDAAAFPVHLLDPVIVNGGTSQTFLGTAPIIGTDNRNTRISVTNNATSIDTILSELFNVSNTVATNVSNLTNGYAEKKVELYFGNGNTTLVHGSGNLRLKGAINVTPVAGQIIVLRFISSLWFEVGRNF